MDIVFIYQGIYPRSVELVNFVIVPVEEAVKVPVIIGAAAVVDRLRDPKLPARDILLNFQLVVRDSCGTRKKELTRVG